MMTYFSNYAMLSINKTEYMKNCYVLTFDPAPKMLFQGDAPEGSDTFQ